MAIRRRKKPNLVLPLSSMGDIAFLLIIFFMLASNFMKTGNVDLQRPGAPTLEQQEPAKCSVITPMNLSIEPNTTRWIIAGRCFSPSEPVYSNSNLSGSCISS